MVRNTVARRERRYKYYFERNAEGKWIPIPFDKSASASASAALDKPDDADESDDDLPIAERRMLATGEKLRRLPVEARYGMRPPLKIPKISSGRGYSYPDYYHGFVDDTYIEVAWKIESSAKNCRLLFGGKKDVYIDVPDLQIAPEDRDDYERGLIMVRKKARVWFYKWGEGNVNEDIWPYQLDTDLFDFIHVKIPRGKSAVNVLITVVLNGITILGPEKIYNSITGTLNLSRDIANCRVKQVPHSDNPVLRVVALELGKAWSPKYGGVWEKRGERFKVQPEKWCTEFASWAIRKATKLKVPEGTNDVSNMARYFMGLKIGSDLEGKNRFITPNKEIVVWDYRDGTVRNEVPRPIQEDYSNNPATDAGNPPSYYRSPNPNYCAWRDLGQAVKPGYFVKTRRGRWVDVEEGGMGLFDWYGDRDNKQKGHSTFFVEWLDGGFDSGRSRNKFKCIGGNQGHKVCMCDMVIDRQHNTRTEHLPNPQFPWLEHGSYEVLIEVFWKETWHAADEHRYFDGFGVTDETAPPLGKPKLETD